MCSCAVDDNFDDNPDERWWMSDPGMRLFIRFPEQWRTTTHPRVRIVEGHGFEPDRHRTKCPHYSIAITLDTYSHVIPGLGDASANCARAE